MPFGEELFAEYGVRTISQKYAANTQQDGQRNQFAGSEREAANGLDLMGARYYSSLQGRFTSTDPLMASGKASNPQSWNRYSYALNNPLKYVDPTGMSAGDPEWWAEFHREMEEGTALDPQNQAQEPKSGLSPIPVRPPKEPEGSVYYSPWDDADLFQINMGETKAYEEAGFSYTGPFVIAGYTNLYAEPLRALMTSPRLPDAVSFSASIGMPSAMTTALPSKGMGWGGTYTLARDGSLYFSGDLSSDVTVRAQPLIGLSLNLIWLNQLYMPTSGDIGNFFPGASHSVYVGGIRGFGAGVTHVKGAGTSTNLGLSTPTASLTSSYGVKLGDTRAKW
jgi:RHS repeat-associated protein